MAEELGEQELAHQYLQISLELAANINKEFWSEQFSSYADFIGTDQQALKLIDEAKIRADTLDKPWAVYELELTRQAIVSNPSTGVRPFVTHHNWVVNTPMEMNIADSLKAIKALETAAKFVNPFGVFVTGIDRDESSESDDGSFAGAKVFSYTGAVMTLPTGVLAVAENNYGRPDKALEYLQRMTRSFSYALPGSMYEVSPDYGMIAQAWNIYSYAVPVVQQFFGINPNAADKEIVIRPMMPTEWHEASLENVQIAENEINLFYKQTADHLWMRIGQNRPDWTLKVVVPQDKQVIEIIQGNTDQAIENVLIAGANGILEFRAGGE
jgi:glycogen debranching enzyme